MLYPELFKQLEAVRWNMDSDIAWDNFDADKLSDEQAMTIKMNAITEWSALPATEMFLRDNRGDSDFSAFMSVWFFEEQKHSLVLMEYLRRFRPELVPTEAELDNVRFEFDPAPALETLMMHFCGEVRLNHWYRRASEWHSEPLIKHIYGLIAKDEARHAGAYLKYLKQAIARAAADSSKSSWVDPMVNVLSGSFETDCATATMVALSTPPDKNAPIGTSLTICSRTARSISPRSSSNALSASRAMMSHGDDAWPRACAKACSPSFRASGWRTVSPPKR